MEMCFYVPGKGTIQDGAREVAPHYFIGQYSREPLDIMQARVPGVELWEFEKAIDAIQAANKAKYCTAPEEITKEKFWYFLEVLPPCKWTHIGGAECFFVSEALTMDLHQWCVRIGDKYWALNRSRFAKPADIIAECAQVSP